jgi:hypothetical protein
MTCPSSAYLKPSLVREIDETTWSDLMLLLDDYCPGLGDQFKDGKQLGKLFLAWAAASGMDLGE